MPCPILQLLGSHTIIEVLPAAALQSLLFRDRMDWLPWHFCFDNGGGGGHVYSIIFYVSPTTAPKCPKLSPINFYGTEVQQTFVC